MDSCVLEWREFGEKKREGIECSILENGMAGLTPSHLPPITFTPNHISVSLGMPEFACLVSVGCWTEWAWLMMLGERGVEEYKRFG